MRVRTFVFPLGVAFMAVAGAASAQCAGSGVVTRIQGKPEEVSIVRGGAPVTRPRVLEVVCAGDVVRTSGGSVVTLSIDGVGAVKVDKARPYTVGPRKGKPGAAGNVYRAVSDQVMPDMKRLPWDVKTKGENDPVRFAAPDGSVQVVSQGRSQLHVRLVDGLPPFRIELLDASGKVLKTVEANSHEVTLTGLSLAPGEYRLVAHSRTDTKAEMRLTVADGVPAPSADIGDLSDRELAAALHALELARADPNKWLFEATQILADAPRGDLDRERVFALIEDYGLNADM